MIYITFDFDTSTPSVFDDDEEDGGGGGGGSCAEFTVDGECNNNKSPPPPPSPPLPLHQVVGTVDFVRRLRFGLVGRRGTAHQHVSLTNVFEFDFFSTPVGVFHIDGEARARSSFLGRIRISRELLFARG
jgi:hypothetical protein